MQDKPRQPQPAHAAQSPLISKGETLLKQGKLAEAGACFQHVLAQDKTNTHAMFRLAIVAFHQKDIQQATRLLEQVLALDPGHSNAQTSLANIYTQTNQPGKAIPLYLELLSGKTANKDLHQHLAINYAKIGQSKEAIGHLNKALRLDPDNIQLLIMLGQEQHKIRDFKASLQTFEKLYRLGVRGPNIFTTLAKCHDILGDLDKAKAVYREGIKTFPNKLYFQYHLSRIDQHSITDRQFDQIEKQIANQQLDAEDTTYGYFLLALKAGQSKNYKQELELLLEGHKHHKQNSHFRYPPSVYLNTLFNRALDRTPEMLEQLPQDKTLASTRPVFMVSVPRSGSTLLEAVIKAGKEPVIDTEESGVMLYANDFNNAESSPGYWEYYLERVKEGYQHLGVYKESCRFSDKMLDHFFMVDVIFHLFPKAKVVWCNRHPVASIMSILKNNMISLSWAHDIDDILQYFHNARALQQHWLERFGDRIHVVDYEAFVSEPELASKALFNYCELDWTPDCLDFHKNRKASRTASSTQIREKIYTRAVNTHKNYAELFEPYTGKYPWLLEQ